MDLDLISDYADVLAKTCPVGRGALVGLWRTDHLVRAVTIRNIYSSYTEHIIGIWATP